MAVNIQNCGNCGSHFVILPSEDSALDTENQDVACPQCSSSDTGPIDQETVIYVDEAVLVDENGEYEVVNLEETAPAPEFPEETQEDIDAIRCVCCKKCFKSRRMLRKHYMYKQKQKVNMCFLCKRTFKYPSILKKHYEFHLNYKPYDCGFCDKTFSAKSALERHLDVHFNERVYSCEICERRFRRLNNLEGHYRLHTGEKPYVCPVCKRRFAWSKACARHQKMFNHSPEIQVPNHLLNVPYTERRYTCEICAQKFMMECMLLSHYYRHPTVKRYVCDDDDCKMFYLSEQRIKKHLADHKTRYLNYRAHLKSETYIKRDTLIDSFDPSNLSEIQDVEEKMETMNAIAESLSEDVLKSLDVEEATNDKPTSSKKRGKGATFRCEMCEKTYSWPYLLTEHYLIHHTNEKSWECSACKERFPSKRYFDFHKKKYNHKEAHVLQLHKTKFACEICELEFDLRGSLLCHYYRHPKAMRYTCEICKVFFLGREQLNEHYGEHDATNNSNAELMEGIGGYDTTAAEESIYDDPEPLTAEDLKKLEDYEGSYTVKFSKQYNLSVIPKDEPTSPTPSTSEEAVISNSSKSISANVQSNVDVSSMGCQQAFAYFFNYGNNNYVWFFNTDANRMECVVRNSPVDSPIASDNEKLNNQAHDNAEESSKNTVPETLSTNPLQCTVCKKEFKFKIALKKHVCRKAEGTVTNSDLVSKANISNTAKIVEENDNSAEVSGNTDATFDLSNPDAVMDEYNLHVCDTCSLAFIEEEHLIAHKEQHKRKVSICIDESGKKRIKNVSEEELSKPHDSIITDTVCEPNKDESNAGVRSILKSSYGITVRNVLSFPDTLGLTDLQCSTMEEGTTYIVNSDQLHKCLLCEEEFVLQSELQKHYEEHDE